MTNAKEEKEPKLISVSILLRSRRFDRLRYVNEGETSNRAKDLPEPSVFCRASSVLVFSTGILQTVQFASGGR
jgi:hypothetical protein